MLHFFYRICKNATYMIKLISVKRSVILVNTYHEDGTKRPLESTSVKLLVSAYYAQFWVDAGNEEILGAHNGM
jgi:hypothetical protein